MSHTPGPWRWRKFGDDWYIVADYGSRKIIIQANANDCHQCHELGLAHLALRDDAACVMRNVSDPANHPDGRLLAAAPTMLETLHGGTGAQPFAMSDNLLYFANQIESGDMTNAQRGVAVGVLRDYARIIEKAIEEAEGKPCDSAK